MNRLEGEQVLLRIFIGDSDRHAGKSLSIAILERLRKEGIAGATVLHGVAGFGANSRVHTAHILRLSEDLPVVIEAVDAEEKIQMFLPILDEMMTEGLVTMEKVRVVRYGGK
jgi:hypothetical protein